MLNDKIKNKNIKKVLLGYSKLAYYYDKIFYHPQNYDKKTVEYLDELFKSYKVEKVLDCACGTGNPSIGLILKGYQVVLSDGSKGMIRKALENASNIGIKSLNIYHCDWFNLKKRFCNIKPFDAVICSGNSFYHLPSFSARLWALKNMCYLLRDKGILYLDYPDWGKEERFKVYPSFKEGDTNILIFRIIEYEGKNMRNHYFYIIKETKKHISFKKIFVPGWKFSDDELFELCKKAGFTLVKVVPYPGPHKHKAIVAEK